MPAPEWLSLLSPLPADAAAQRKPVASAQQIAEGTAGPIEGWESITINLSEPDYGLRFVHITLDKHGDLIAASDSVMFVLETTPDGLDATLARHENIGGRFERDGSFRGTHWITVQEHGTDDDESSVTRSAEQRPPTESEVADLRRLIDWVLKR